MLPLTNRLIKEGSMGRKRRKSRKNLLTQFEQNIALLHKNKFKDECIEEKRLSLLSQYIRGVALTPKQKSLVAALAAPLRSEKRRVRAELRRRTHWVYAISDGAFVKIGFATSVAKRMNDLQVANPSELKVEAKIKCERRADAKRLESEIHCACEGHRVRGEWFNMDALVVFDKFSDRDYRVV